MKRRNFINLLASLPFIGLFIKPVEAAKTYNKYFIERRVELVGNLGVCHFLYKYVEKKRSDVLEKAIERASSDGVYTASIIGIEREVGYANPDSKSNHYVEVKRKLISPKQLEAMFELGKNWSSV